MRFSAIAVLFLFVIAIGYVAYAERFQLAAKICHWRHGCHATKGSYDVAVPERWFLEQDSVGFTLINTARRFLAGIASSTQWP
jgi:hypothetical protein